MQTQTPKVIYEDNHLLIVNKPAGMLAQGDRTGDNSLVDWGKNYIKVRYDKPGAVFCGLVHRLDRPVSGAVALARTSKALERMTKLFRTRDVTKTYWAVSHRRPEQPEGKLVHWLQKDPKRNHVQAFDRPEGEGKKAELRYKLLGKINHHYLLEIYPLTGRPHQIRVQLAAMGCPIRGDVKYGSPKANPNGNINLHARRLAFIHPVRKTPLLLEAGLPGDDNFWNEFLSLEHFKVKDKQLEYYFSG